MVKEQVIPNESDPKKVGQEIELKQLQRSCNEAATGPALGPFVTGTLGPWDLGPFFGQSPALLAVLIHVLHAGLW